MDSLGEIDLDDLKISGEPDVAVEGINMITSAVYRLLMAQQQSVKLFKQMYSGPPTSIFDKLFGVTEKVKAKKDVKNCCCDYKEGSKDSEENQSKPSRVRSFIDDLKFKIRNSNGLDLSRSTAINAPTSSKKDPIKKLTRVVEALQVQLQTLTAFSRQTTDNTGKTVEAIKNIKIGNSSVVPLAGSSPQGSSTTPESLLNSRADYSLSPYSLNVPST